MIIPSAKVKRLIYCVIILSALNLLFFDQAFAANQNATVASKQATQAQFLPLSDYTTVIGDDEPMALAALSRIEKFNDEASTAMLIEMVYQVPSRNVLEKLIALIEKKSGRTFNGDVNAFYEWLWSSERPVHPRLYWI